MSKIAKKLYLIPLLLFAIIAAALAPIASADMYRYDFLGQKSNWFYLGGLNKFNGAQIMNETEANQIEQELIVKGYMLISTENANVLYEDMEKFRDSNGFWFNNFLFKNSHGWASGKCRVYVCKQTYFSYMEQLEEGNFNRLLAMELNESTVVLDYLVWYYENLIGTEFDVINETIPPDVDSAYIKILSSVDCIVTLLHNDSQRHYTLYVKRNTPFLAKIVAGCYHISDVSSYSIPLFSENKLPYNNELQIDYWTATKENPYLIDLRGLIQKYNIPDANLDGMPNYNLNRPKGEDTYEDVANEEVTIIQSPDEASEKKSVDIWRIIIWIILGFTVLSGIIWLIQNLRKKDGEDEDEQNGN